LTPLSEFSNLTSLDLRDNPITLQQIAELEAVLPNCNITHNAIEGCAVCGKHENFCDCIEIKGEKYLKTATHLDLSGKELTISDLTPLSEFSNLTSLDLRDNPITLQQIAELEAVLPNCNITHNTPCDCNEPDCEECFPPPPEFELGDCNNDGRINIADLTYLKYAIVRNNPEVFPFNDQCKVAGEEASDALNLSTLRNYLTGKTKQLTVDN
ncbi:MAG: hypothetical protein FWH05_07045, partial [Oscillospiraceae bacterium]|nr:hypothetical protein [Oscillospiraceae bacterium]